MKKIILLSDSHHSLDERIFPHLKECDEIWHAGDIGDLKVTDKLKKYAPLRAVWGNVDSQKVRKEFRETTYFKCEELKVMMTHIGGYPGRYEKGVKEILEYKRPNLFISGHSHILKVMHDKKLDILHMNPGAIGNYGWHKVKTILAFNVEGKDIKDLRVIEFPRGKD
ncbi:MAG: metallophosphoesterase family protein [Flavobacteriales bacterium]|nr:metallophosphoesterase family protein [Flavobacteriales bacterium]